jgi:outer membrane receptor protein involved in Fe transport
MKKRYLAAMVALALCAPITSFAEETKEEKIKSYEAMFPKGEPSEEDVYRADRMLVSATKHIMDVSKAPAIATVITAEDLRIMGARNILDALATIPGIGISRGPYSVFQVEIRGLTSIRQNKVKFMIDGHSVKHPTTGDVAWQMEDIALEQVERIEVIRGPGSALYGANAFSGVINVVTKMGNDFNATQISAGGGSFETGRVNIIHGQQYGDVDVLASLTYNTTDGAQQRVESDAIGQAGNTDDWARTWDGTLKVSWHDLIFLTRYTDRENGPYVGVTNVVTDQSELLTDQFLADLSYSKAMNEKWNLSGKAYYDWAEVTYEWQLFPPGMAFSPAPVHFFPEGMYGTPHYVNQTYGAELGSDYALSESNTLTMGLVYEYSKQSDITHQTNFNPVTLVNLGPYQDISAWGNWSIEASRKNSAAYIQDEWAITDGLTLTAGLRYDYYDDIGSSTNPRLGLVWELLKDVDLKLLYGEAFRVPTFDELYSTNNPAAIGNEDLKPEEMRTYEVSVGYTPTYGPVVTASGFYNKFSDKIMLVPTGIPGMQEFSNTSDATIYGLELEGRYKIKNVELYGNYFWQHPEDDATGDQLPDVPTYRVNLGVNFWLANWGKGNIHLLNVGDSARATGDSRQDADGYTLVNASFIVLDFFKTMELRASLYNIFDETYAYPAPTLTLANDYPAPGRSVFLELRYTF